MLPSAPMSASAAPEIAREDQVRQDRHMAEAAADAADQHADEVEQMLR